jgi:hypothetical protein
VTVLGHGEGADGDAARHLHEAREQLGSGLAALDSRATWEGPAEAVAGEVERRPCDLVVLPLPTRDGVDLAEGVLRAGQHHVLLVPVGAGARTPRKVLICVAVGEPGKEDVSFTGRLACQRRQGVPVETRIRQGGAREIARC